MADQETQTATIEAPPAPKKYVWGVGRRKSAVARVRIAPGTGKIQINERELNDYFTAERDRKAIFGPLEVTNTGGEMDVFGNATGRGPAGQARAIGTAHRRAVARHDNPLP